MTISRYSSNAIKGFCIILIALHHYTQNFGYLPDVLLGVGPVACSAFFFISGYGLSLNAGDKQKWEARMKKIYFPFLLSNGLYIAIKYCTHSKLYNLQTILSDFFGISLANGHCWFIQLLLLFYITTALVDISNVQRRKLVIAFLSLLVGGFYVVITKSIGSLSWMVFPVGVIMSNIKIGDKLLILLSIISVINYFLYLNYGEMLINTPFLLINFISLVITTPFFFILVGERFSKLDGLLLLGKNSIDIYLMHGIGIILFGFIAIKEPLQFVFFIIVVIIVSRMFCLCRQYILKWF